MSLLQKTAYSAAILAVISGLISVYWACGGTMGIATVGGSIEALAHDASLAARLLAFATALVKFAGALFALAFIQKWGQRLPIKALTKTCAILGGLMLLYGLMNVAAGALVLRGFIHAPGADLYALKWHVFFWDAYFVVWGGTLVLLSYAAHRNTKSSLTN